MAYYFLHPEIDTTIYSHPDRTNLNAGHDEILEIVKEKGSSDQIYYPSRVLIKFNNEEIKTTISDILDTDICYICVPTPTSDDGSCNVSIVDFIPSGPGPSA